MPQVINPGITCSDAIIKGLASVPADIFGLIFSNLTYLDLFHLKVAGNHHLASIISGLPKPDFMTYVSQIQKSSSKTYPKAEGIENGFYFACEKGDETLFLKLLSQKPRTDRFKESYDDRFKEADILVNCSICAINCQQKSMLQVVLRCMDSTPRALYSAVRSPGNRKQVWIYRRPHLAEISLKFAASKNRLWAVQALLKHGVKASSKQGLEGLNIAVMRGHQEVVAALSKRATGATRRTLTKALPKAVEGGYDGIIRIILSHGAALPRPWDPRSFLHRAAEYGHNSTIKFLLSRIPQDYYVCPEIGTTGDRLYSYWPGKSAYQRTFWETLKFENWCCLHFAIHNGHQHTVEFLFKNNIMPPTNPEYRATALPLAALRGHVEITKLLLAAGFDASAKLWRFTALELASKYGHTDVIKLLLDAGVPATALDLANAVSSGSIPAVSLLLERGANLHGIAARTGDTALHAAVGDNNKEMLEFILKSGANVEIRDSSRTTPLYKAIVNHNEDAVRILFEYGAIVEPHIKSGMKPKKPGTARSVLHHALLNRAGNLVPLLLKYGAIAEGATDDVMTPFLRAASCGSVPALEALHAAGCHIHARDDEKRTALHYAAGERYNGNTDTVEALLRLGLDPNSRDAEGKTPLHLAPCSQMSPSYDLLVRHGGDDKALDYKGVSVASCQHQSWINNYH